MRDDTDVQLLPPREPALLGPVTIGMAALLVGTLLFVVATASGLASDLTGNVQVVLAVPWFLSIGIMVGALGISRHSLPRIVIGLACAGGLLANAFAAGRPPWWLVAFCGYFVVAFIFALRGGLAHQRWVRYLAQQGDE